MIDAHTPTVYALEAHREQIDPPPQRRRWWQRQHPMPPTGPQRERFLFTLRAEDLSDDDAGRRIALTPFGPLSAIVSVGASIDSDGIMISIYTLDVDYFLPYGTPVYMMPLPDTRGHELRFPLPPIEQRPRTWIDPDLALDDDVPHHVTGFARDGGTFDVVEVRSRRYGIPRTQGMPR